ncbi:hypothetical protein MYCTH_2059686 [Thermothelomyces thermophilus ATCC 42464]|uniref:ABC transporter domain-containing protein n=1 Tax=Thermothelomyces thermophilus (strain ATCC 42464 / BCRC 31852 / DSM 1799) TaxID=573729 RepID=G2Q9W3_THET4|nr:uncharacterized protein MYCTH_2059686 [Thermothelomyces thermophilus ATCC 42464]AEO56572.1 hypothetical protein MYCTH_2059686 [Thermothelomyces thermophilus ATCC 42464]
MSFGEQLALIIRFYTDLETSIGAVSRLKAFSENVKPESWEGETLVPPAEWPLHGAIEINGVSAAYGDSEDKDTTKNLALDNLHLTVAPGEKVAICGRSGSGKSSLLLLLLRLVDPLASTTTPPTPDEEEGKTIQPKLAPMAIDGLPLHAMSRPHLRRRIIALPQEPVFLPSGTPVQTNLDPHHSATAADCRAALEAVSLWPFIASRGGLDAPLAPDTLSQGQKQLFSLARAIVRRRVRARERAAEFGSDYCGDLRDGGVLLLDEVSSSVDQETDEEMQRVIRAEFAAYTIVMVSHRLGMVMGFDRVVIMDAGRIVESGRPGELVEREGSRFRELWMVGNGGKG